MKLILCPMCEGGLLWKDNEPCIQCEDTEVFHIVDSAMQDDYVIVPCNCSACSKVEEELPSQAAVIRDNGDPR